MTIKISSSLNVVYIFDKKKASTVFYMLCSSFFFKWHLVVLTRIVQYIKIMYMVVKNRCLY